MQTEPTTRTKRPRQPLAKIIVAGIGLTLLAVGILVTASMSYQMLTQAGNLTPLTSLAALSFYEGSLIFWLAALIYLSTSWLLVGISAGGLTFTFLLIVTISGLKIGGIDPDLLGPRTAGIVLETGIILNLALHILFLLAHPSIWNRLKLNAETAQLFNNALADFQESQAYEARKGALQKQMADEMMTALEEEAALTRLFRPTDK